MLLVFALKIYDFIEIFVNLIDKFLVPSWSFIVELQSLRTIVVEKLFNGTNNFSFQINQNKENISNSQFSLALLTFDAWAVQRS